MEYTKTIDNWTFEVVQVRARKTKQHKNPYSAIANITIANGVPHIEGLLSTEKFVKSDYNTFNLFLNDLGFDECIYRRM